MSTEVHPSFCRVCANGCPVLVHVEDGRAVKIEGDPEGPIHESYTCHRGRALPELTNSPQRLLHSLKRGADGTHEPIPSEQALDEIADALRTIVDRHGPRSVALYTGTAVNKGVAGNNLAVSFMEAIGSPMRFTPNTIDQPGKHVAKGLHGYWMAPPQAFDEPDVVLWIGINPLVTYTGLPFGHPGRFFKDMAARGGRIIVIDPRRTDVAKRAFLHLQPKPGHDVAILAAMLRVVIEEELYDKAFVADNVDGLDALREAVAPFTPDVVARMADVPADDLVLAARTFAGGRRGYAVAGTGPNMGTAQGTLFEYLVLNLDTLCGHHLRQGEVVRTPGTLLPRMRFKAQAVGPVEAFGFGERLRVRNLTDTLAGLPVSALAEEILTPGDGQVRALLVVGGNPVAAWPDQLLAMEAMRSLDLLVSVDVRLGQTARLAHYVIAPTTVLEVPGMRTDFPVSYANAYGGYPDTVAQYTPAIVDRPPGSDLLEEWEVFYGLAQRMGYQLSLHAAPAYRVMPPPKGTPTFPPLDMARKPTSDELLELMTARARVPLAEVKRHPHGAHFPPEEPVVVEAKDAGWEGRLQVGHPLMMRDLRAAHGVDDVAAAVAEGFPFRLLVRRMHQINSSLHTPAIDRGRPYNPAFVHPDDLARLGVADGDEVDIVSARATVRAIVAGDTTLRPGLVSMAHCFGGGPDDDDRVREIGSAANRLLSADQVFEPYTGQPLMSNVPVDIRPRR